MIDGTYLGDGLYVKDDGYQIELSTLEGNCVYLDSHVLYALFEFLGRTRNVKITVESRKNAVEENKEHEETKSPRPEDPCPF